MPKVTLIEVPTLLPFLKNIKSPGIAGTIIKNRAPDEAKSEDQSEDSSIKSHIKGLLSAIKSDDHEYAEDCLRSIFKSLEQEPHEEIEHKAEPHSYDSQNEDAAD